MQSTTPIRNSKDDLLHGTRSVVTALIHRQCQHQEIDGVEGVSANRRLDPIVLAMRAAEKGG